MRSGSIGAWEPYGSISHILYLELFVSHALVQDITDTRQLTIFSDE